MDSVIAIDPGTTESAVVVFDEMQIVLAEKMPNAELVRQLADGDLGIQPVACEWVQSYGKPVGAEVFTTCLWVGRFIEAHGGEHRLIPRPEVKMHLCQSVSKVTDAVIRQRIIDLYGGKAAAIGLKKTPGPLYGVKADVWQALAVAITWREKYGAAAVRASAV